MKGPIRHNLMTVSYQPVSIFSRLICFFHLWGFWCCCCGVMLWTRRSHQGKWATPHPTPPRQCNAQHLKINCIRLLNLPSMSKSQLPKLAQTLIIRTRLWVWTAVLLLHTAGGSRFQACLFMGLWNWFDCNWIVTLLWSCLHMNKNRFHKRYE